MSFSNYLTEIITKKEWKDAYKDAMEKLYPAFNMQEYKRALRILKQKIFKKKGQREIFLNPRGEIKKQLNTGDKDVIEFINSSEAYRIPEHKQRSLYFTGYAIKKKGGKLVPIKEVLTNWANKEKDQDKKQAIIDKLKKELAKEPNVGKEKQIAAMEKSIKEAKGSTEHLDWYENRRQSLGLNSKNIICLTYEPRKIASQSTRVSWRSCMNLGVDEAVGQYSKAVGSSIESGTFIAWVAKPDDKYTLDSPTGRLLIKSYISENGDIAWAVASKEYGTINDIEAVTNTINRFLNKHNDMKDDYYILDPRNYNDGDKTFILNDKGMKKKDYTGSEMNAIRVKAANKAGRIDYNDPHLIRQYEGAGWEDAVDAWVAHYTDWENQPGGLGTYFRELAERNAEWITWVENEEVDYWSIMPSPYRLMENIYRNLDEDGIYWDWLLFDDAGHRETVEEKFMNFELKLYPEYLAIVKDEKLSENEIDDKLSNKFDGDELEALESYHKNYHAKERSPFYEIIDKHFDEELMERALELFSDWAANRLRSYTALYGDEIEGFM